MATPAFPWSTMSRSGGLIVLAELLPELLCPLFRLLDAPERVMKLIDGDVKTSVCRLVNRKEPYALYVWWRESVPQTDL